MRPHRQLPGQIHTQPPSRVAQYYPGTLAGLIFQINYHLWGIRPWLRGVISVRDSLASGCRQLCPSAAFVLRLFCRLLFAGYFRRTLSIFWTCVCVCVWFSEFPADMHRVEGKLCNRDVIFMCARRDRALKCPRTKERLFYTLFLNCFRGENYKFWLFFLWFKFTDLFAYVWYIVDV